MSPLTKEIYDNLYNMINELKESQNITDYLTLEGLASNIVYLDHFELELTESLKEDIINELCQEGFANEDLEYDIINNNNESIINFFGEYICQKIVQEINLPLD